MNNYYFIFKNIDSRDMGLEIVEMPNIVKPESSIDFIDIPGNNNGFYIDLKTYKPYNISIACTINPFYTDKKSIDNILAWLDGFGDLIVSQESDKIYSAVIINNINLSNVIWLYPQFLITFRVQPLKKSVNYINEELEINSESLVNNPGTVDSEPIITIYGNGEITLTVNEEEFQVVDVDEYITINSEILEVYKDNLNENNKYNNFTFPKLKSGNNILNIYGDYERVKIIPNWRWI